MRGDGGTSEDQGVVSKYKGGKICLVLFQTT